MGMKTLTRLECGGDLSCDLRTPFMRVSRAFLGGGVLRLGGVGGLWDGVVVF